MADTNRLVLTFSVVGGEDRSFSYQHADPSTSTANVKDLGDALITNGSIFQYPPVQLKAAKIVTVTTTDYDLSGD